MLVSFVNFFAVWMKIVPNIPDDCDLYGWNRESAGLHYGEIWPVGTWSECKDNCKAEARCVAVTYVDEYVRI